VKCYLQGEKVIFTGKFNMTLTEDENHYWSLRTLQVEGIEF
jgi:hypothetical protein